MTKYNLILELTNIINNLLEEGVTGEDAQIARKQINDCFDRFEENEATEIAELGAILDNIASRISNLPKELQEYFQAIDNFQNLNEIFLGDLPAEYAHHRIEAVQAMSGVFDTFNTLLDTGINPCTAHDARIKIDNLFCELGQMAQTQADDPLSNFFPNLADDLAELTILKF